MYFALLLVTFTGAAASNMDDASEATALYMFDDPPVVLRLLWAIGSMCALLAVGVSIYNIKQHEACATLQGFGQDELISSFGAKVPRWHAASGKRFSK